MNSHIPVDLQENIAIATDTFPTADELLTAVCDYHFLINIIVEQTLPKLRKYTEENYECELKIDTIVIATDTYPTADEVLAAVCNYPFLINIIVE